MSAPSPQFTLDDQQVLRLMRSASFRRDFPHLDHAFNAGIRRKGGCGRCGRKKAVNTFDLRSVRKAVANLPNEQKVKLKKVLNTKQVIVTYADDNNRVIKLKF